jgi:hypothetical protein
MIYIYDDRAQRRKDNSEKLKNYSDLITFKTIVLIPGKPVDDCIIDSIENPDYVIFHKSYIFEDKNITFDTIRKLLTSLDVPVVIFSGGLENSNKSNGEININADLMYENLPLFLEDYKNSGRYNVDVLLWGKRYKLNALLQFQNEFSRKFLINTDPNGIIDDLKGDVLRMINQTFRKINMKDIGDKIISDINELEQITGANLITIIDHNIQNFK